MIEKIKALWIKYEEIIAYLIVGGLTTVVSWAAKFLANFLLFDNTMYPTPFQNIVLSIINWTAGVIFVRTDRGQPHQYDDGEARTRESGYFLPPHQ